MEVVLQKLSLFCLKTNIREDIKGIRIFKLKICVMMITAASSKSKNLHISLRVNENSINRTVNTVIRVSSKIDSIFLVYLN